MRGGRWNRKERGKQEEGKDRKGKKLSERIKIFNWLTVWKRESERGNYDQVNSHDTVKSSHFYKSAAQYES